ncbi:atherin-like [Manis pentadactyla]|uniref:atherin-like n=1 Tax=Manis pentadactyla TaxID=143292 RepID=UPI00255CA236|nr:atherin-like [Manis pentadactyla]
MRRARGRRGGRNHIRDLAPPRPAPPRPPFPTLACCPLARRAGLPLNMAAPLARGRSVPCACAMSSLGPDGLSPAVLAAPPLSRLPAGPTRVGARDRGGRARRGWESGGRSACAGLAQPSPPRSLSFPSAEECLAGCPCPGPEAAGRKPPRAEERLLAGPVGPFRGP